MRYTPLALDRMRRAIADIPPPDYFTRDEHDAQIERRMLTAIAADVGPDELEDHVKELRRQEQEHHERVVKQIHLQIHDGDETVTAECKEDHPALRYIL